MAQGGVDRQTVLLRVRVLLAHEPENWSIRFRTAAEVHLYSDSFFCSSKKY